jgi:hypothetical protein
MSGLPEVGLHFPEYVIREDYITGFTFLKSVGE